MAEREVLIVGAGLGAMRVASQLRQRGCTGPITVLGAEPHLPYDRPPLSKQVLRGESNSTTFSDLDGLNVNWKLGTRAVSLNVTRSQVTTNTGEKLGYDVLVLAPGGRARTLPGFTNTPGVYVLRTIDDALALRTLIRPGSRLIVIGAGFIGCEIAASARKSGAEVDLVESLASPLVRVLGTIAAEKVAKLHLDNGVKLHLSATVSAILTAPDGRASGIRLGDSSEIAGDAIVVGIGIVPDVEWLAGSGIELQDGIVCDSRGRTNIPNVYALGDAAQWLHKLAGKHRRVEHWTSTTDQAAVVAANIAGPGSDEAIELDAAPYFWSDQYDTKIQGMGFIDPADHVDEITIRDRTVLLYSCDGILTGVVGFTIPIAVMRTKPLIERRATVAEAIALLSP